MYQTESKTRRGGRLNSPKIAVFNGNVTNKYIAFNLQLFAEKEDTKKPKTKRLPILITLLLAFVLVVVSVPVVAIISKNNANAFKTGDTSNFVEVGEIWDSINKKFNKDNLKTLIGYLSSDYTINNIPTKATATDIRNYTKNGKSSDKAIVVTLGGLKWQVVYLTKDTDGNNVATLLLNDTTDTALWQTWSYVGDGRTPSNMYGTSYMRAVVLNNGGYYVTDKSGTRQIVTKEETVAKNKYAPFTVDSFGLTSYIVTPSKISYQLNSQGTVTVSDTAYRLNNEALNVGGSSGDYSGKTGYKNWQNDYVWLPSLSEEGWDDSNQGIWKLSIAERAISSSSYSWSRSSYYINSNYAYYVSPSGSSNSYNSVSNSYAVRSALHLNLQSAVLSTASALSASIAGSGGSLDKTSDLSFGTSDIATFTYTTNTNYCINDKAISINNTAVSINESKPSTYSTVGSVQYKCWRSTNKVMVEVTNVSSATTIKGTVSTLWSVESKDSTLSIQSKTDRENWFTSYAKIVAKYEQNSNILLTIDNVSQRLVSSGGAGEMAVNNGTATYTFTAYNNFITIEMNLPNGPHTASIDHYTGTSAPINVSVAGGTATKSVVKVDDDLYRIFVTPEGNNWVHDFSIDSNNVLVEYCEANVYRIGNATSIKYIAKDTTNVFIVELRGLFGEINFSFNLVNTQPTLKNPPSGGSILGTVVTATEGGEARIVGNDIANSENDSDTVTFVAVAYTGYTFAGWVDANNDTQFLSTLASVRLTKEQINGKVVKAIFVKTESSKVNQETNNTNDIL